MKILEKVKEIKNKRNLRDSSFRPITNEDRAYEKERRHELQQDPPTRDSKTTIEYGRDISAI
jgi:hypothetical protein